MLDSPAQFVERSGRAVGHEGGDQTGEAVGAEKLVDDDIAGHARQGEVREFLSDDLVRGGDRHEVAEAFQRDGVPIVEMGADRL